MIKEESKFEDIKIPGTIHLVDIEGTLDVKHEEDDNIVLIPQPTDDPEDPLNWSKWRKRKVALCLLLAVFVGDILTTSLSAVLLVIEEDTGISLADLNTGVGIQYLFFGWSNLLWQPLGLTFGRRPVILFCGLGCMLCTVWTSYVTSTGEWYANRLICGTFYGPIETLIEISIADIYQVHLRGGWIAWYCWTLFNVPFLSGIVAGFISDDKGWRWIQFIAAIISSACLIIMFFFMEETMFYRDHALELGSVEEIKSDGSSSEPSELEPKSSNYKVEIDKLDSSEVLPKSYQTKTFAQRLKFWGARDPRQKNVFWQSMYMPFVLVQFIPILYAGLTVGVVLSVFNVVNATISTVLSSPPYNFSANMIGVFFISPAIGITIGSYFSGAIVDKFTIIQARKGKGFREPESRLWLAVVPMIIHPFGCLLYGIGASHGIHWIGLAFGLGMICSTFPIGSAIAINYIIDCYKEVSGDGLVTMILIRNSMGFGFSYAVTPWLQAVGTQNLYIAIAFIGVFFWSLSFIMIAFGKKFRKSNAAAYWNLVEKHELKAH
ncbi:MFS general substrate transporter [Scheffersomyces amazonensis]|uniref:MFS general substrate transporter n=1 Tax=Scheffersomyces amazonensis TaxID=1078765 RepID=UPI00315CA3CD